MTQSLPTRFSYSSSQALSPHSLSAQWTRTAHVTRLFSQAAIKRGLDLFIAALALLVLSPIMAFVALLIKLTDGGPILYWQTRVGRHGELFQFPKFRSMVVDADRLRAELIAENHHGESITFKMARDPRITPIGAFIRKTSIDELPQLWLVLRGHMSLVGPRPPLPSEVARYDLHARRRLDLRPGLTCLWQVMGRGDLPFEEQLNLDIQYIESQSLRLDLWLLILTIPAVLLGRGAY